MNHHRATRLPCKNELLGEGAPLFLSWRVVVVIVETALAKRYSAGCDRFPKRCNVARTLKSDGVMRMYTGCMPDEPGVRFGDYPRGASGAEDIPGAASRADAYDRLGTSLASASYYVAAVAVERRVGEVRVAVGERRAIEVFLGHFFSIQIRIGAATYIELNVPVKIPKAMTHAKGLITSPPSSSSAITDVSESEWVMTERGSVSLIDLFSVS